MRLPPLSFWKYVWSDKVKSRWQIFPAEQPKARFRKAAYSSKGISSVLKIFSYGNAATFCHELICNLKKQDHLVKVNILNNFTCGWDFPSLHMYTRTNGSPFSGCLSNLVLFFKFSILNTKYTLQSLLDFIYKDWLLVVDKFDERLLDRL